MMSALARMSTVLVVVLSVYCSRVSAQAVPEQSGATPNVVFILADDQCYQAVHALGCDELDTPNLDRLLREGVTFTHAYNQGSWSGAVCIASRTMLNTGRFLWHAQRVYDSAEEERRQEGSGRNTCAVPAMILTSRESGTYRRMPRRLSTL